MRVHERSVCVCKCVCACMPAYDVHTGVLCELTKIFLGANFHHLRC